MCKGLYDKKRCACRLKCCIYVRTSVGSSQRPWVRILCGSKGSVWDCDTGFLALLSPHMSLVHDPQTAVAAGQAGDCLDF